MHVDFSQFVDTSFNTTVGARDAPAAPQRLPDGLGHHEAAWRLPESDPFAHTRRWPTAINLAQIAERGKLDSVFLADGPALWGNAGAAPAGALEPTVLLTALAAVTSASG